MLVSGKVEVGQMSTTLSSEYDTMGMAAKPKSGAQLLYGGAISASIASVASVTSEIDMTKLTQGGLEVLVNSGTGSWSFALYSCNTSGGTYVPVLSGGNPVTIAVPATGGSTPILNMTENYYKLVPTLTGTSNITCSFTKGV